MQYQLVPFDYSKFIFDHFNFNQLESFPPHTVLSSLSYLVMPFMGTDLGKLMKMQKLSEEKIQYFVYQMLKGLKVENSTLILFIILLLDLNCSVE